MPTSLVYLLVFYDKASQLLFSYPKKQRLLHGLRERLQDFTSCMTTMLAAVPIRQTHPMEFPKNSADAEWENISSPTHLYKQNSAVIGDCSTTPLSNQITGQSHSTSNSASILSEQSPGGIVKQMGHLKIC